MAAALRLRMLAGALQQRQPLAVPAAHRSNSAATATATAAPSPRGRPKLLLAFALTPEMELEGCVESFWLPAAMPRLAELAELTITKTPEEFAAALSAPGHGRFEVIFSFAELDWPYKAMAQHKRELLAGGLKLVVSASSGAEKLSPIWVGTDVVCTNGKGSYAYSLAEFCLTSVLYFNKHFPRLARQRAARLAIAIGRRVI